MINISSWILIKGIWTSLTRQTSTS